MQVHIHIHLQKIQKDIFVSCSLYTSTVKYCMTYKTIKEIMFSYVCIHIDWLSYISMLMVLVLVVNVQVHCLSGVINYYYLCKGSFCAEGKVWASNVFFLDIIMHYKMCKSVDVLDYFH